MATDDSDIGRLIAEVSFMRREIDELKHKAVYRAEQESFNELHDYRISTVEERVDSIKAKAKPIDLVLKGAKLIGIAIGVLVGVVSGAGVWEAIKKWME